MISIRFSALTLSLAGLALGGPLGLTGCERQIEGERRDVQEARSDAAEAERKAAQEKVEAERDLAEKKAEIDRDLAEKNAAIAEEQREADQADTGLDVDMDPKLKTRLDSFDRKLSDMRSEAARLEGAAKTEADRTIADLERRRMQLKTDLAAAGTQGSPGMQDKDMQGKDVQGQGTQGQQGTSARGTQGQGTQGSPGVQGTQGRGTQTPATNTSFERTIDQLDRDLDKALEKARASVKKG